MGRFRRRTGRPPTEYWVLFENQRVTVVTSHIYLMEDIPDDDVVSYSKILRIVPVARRKRKFQRSPEIG